MNKTEIKVSAEGVAKLNFNFLEELQHDSSLEPGEVKTPPEGNSPITKRSITPDAANIQKKDQVNIVKEIAAPATTTITANTTVTTISVPSAPTTVVVSELDAAALCKEKVRAILELDAQRNKEEAAKRKREMAERRQSGELDEEEKEKKQKAKEERRRLKKLKKEQQAARLALLSDEEEEEKTGLEISKKNVYNMPTKSHDSTEKELHNYGCVMPPMGGLPPPPPYLGYRGMGPTFPHNVHMRGGFMSRARNHMRGGPRFTSGYRLQFFGCPPLRHANTLQRQHTPPPARGHSPITAPNSNLLWTKWKPSISYAYNPRSSDDEADKQQHQQQKSEVDSVGMDKEAGATEKIKSKKMKSKKTKSKKVKKDKKSKREIKKTKKDKKSHLKSKKKNTIDKSSKRKIEKLRKLMKKRTKLETEMAAEEESPSPDALHKKDKDKIPSKQKQREEEQEEEKSNKTEKYKHKKNKTMEADELLRDITPPFELMKDSVKIQSADDVAITPTKTKQDTKKSAKGDKDSDDSRIDIFAESPSSPLLKSVVVEKSHKAEKTMLSTSDNYTKQLKEREKSSTKPTKKSSPNRAHSDKRSSTPPLRELAEKSSLQKQLEIRKRIDELLQDDDLEIKTLEATKQKLLQTNKCSVTQATEPPVRAAKSRSPVRFAKSGSPKICLRIAKSRSPSKQHTKSRSPIQKHAKSRSPIRHDNKSRSPIRYDVKSRSPIRHDVKSRSPIRYGVKSRSPIRYDVKSHSPVGFAKSRSPVRHTNPFRRSRSHSPVVKGRKEPTVGEYQSREQKGKEYRDTKSRTISKERQKRSDERLSFSNERKRRSPSRDVKKFDTRAQSRGREKTRSTSQKRSLSDRSSVPPKRTHRSESSPTMRRSEKHNKRAFSKHRDDKSTQKSSKSKRVTTPADKRERDDLEKNKKSKKTNQPLSFTAAEFLFPDDNDVDSEFATLDDDGSLSISPRLKKLKSVNDENSSNNEEGSGESQDTDEYMDNWENDDTELDINSICTPLLTLIPDEGSSEKLVSQFINPSPPPKQLITSSASPLPPPEPERSTTPTALPPSEKVDAMPTQTVVEKKTKLEMQEIYDEFIKSVEASGSAIECTALNEIPAAVEIVEAPKAALDTSSTSESSSASSSDHSNTSSSSTSSTSSSSTEDSNDSLKFKQQKQKKVRKTDPNKATAPVERSETPPLTPPIAAIIPTAPCSVSTPPPTESATTPAKTPKSDANSDFKKLKTLEANLRRIQQMICNFDSSDELRTELGAMEKLFINEKNMLLLKYAKSPSLLPQKADDSVVAETSTEIADVGVMQTPFVNSMQQLDAGDAVPDKIFDVNREAIKLTLSPLKQCKTTAALKPLAAEHDEADFTEKLAKPVKEIAIVKPMMESKDRRSSSQRSRRSHTRERGRRSTSRSRAFSPHRGRGNSLSISPTRYGGARGQDSMGQRDSYRQRIRSRSRSHSRSPPRHIGRRRGDFRRRQGPFSGPHSRRSTRSQSRRHSPRSYTPRPASPPMRRRSPSRDTYSCSRSPLPFKPPSPPMQPNVDRNSSVLRTTFRPGSSSLSRSRSHSLTPPSPRPTESPSSSYDDHRHHRGNSYGCHSPSTDTHQYYSTDGDASSPYSSSSYYYNVVSPKGISVDARINIVVNTPPGVGGGQESANNNAVPYDSYAPYGPYSGGAYMAQGPNPEGYYGGQYGHHPSQVYSNIPTISGVESSTPSTHFYYEEYQGHIMQQQQTHSSSVLKELPKATVAVQKGNVLEIVPSSEMPTVLPNKHANEQKQQQLQKQELQPKQQQQLHLQPQQRQAQLTFAENREKKRKNLITSIQEEIRNRQVRSAVMRLTRENDENARSILKKTQEMKEVDGPSSHKVGGKTKKRVFFEDGIYPDHVSEDEDLEIAKEIVRRKLRRLRRRGLGIPGLSLGEELINMGIKPEEPKLNAEIANLPPPPPPTGYPPENLVQPIYLKTQSEPLRYIHYNGITDSIYLSNSEFPHHLPPPPQRSIKQRKGSSPQPDQDSDWDSNDQGRSRSRRKGKRFKESRSNRSGRSSPRTIPSLIQRREPTSVHTPSSPHVHAHSIEMLHPGDRPLTPMANMMPKGNFQPMYSPQSPQMSPHSPMPPSNFPGMRINYNNYARLPPSPLVGATGIRGMPPPNAIPVIGMRPGVYGMPPPGVFHPGTPPQYQQSHPQQPHPQQPHPQIIHPQQQQPHPQQPHPQLQQPHPQLQQPHPQLQQPHPQQHPHLYPHPHPHLQQHHSYGPLPIPSHMSPHYGTPPPPAPQRLQHPAAVNYLSTPPPQSMPPPANNANNDSNVATMQPSSNAQAMVAPYNVKAQ